jgi:hypothetical protein
MTHHPLALDILLCVNCNIMRMADYAHMHSGANIYIYIRQTHNREMSFLVAVGVYRFLRRLSTYSVMSMCCYCE